MSDTQSKPQVEVTEETRETLSVLDLDRKPRPEKTALENAYFDGAHEVRFHERSFKARHDASLDEVRAFVDALEVRRREVAPLPEPPAPEPVNVPARVPDHYRGPLERAIRGTIVGVETVHRIGTGTVVDVQWQEPTGSSARGLYLVMDDEARPYDDVASRIDALPTPDVPEPEAKAETEAEAKAEVPAPEKPKRKRFGFGKK